MPLVLATIAALVILVAGCGSNVPSSSVPGGAGPDSSSSSMPGSTRSAAPVATAVGLAACEPFEGRIAFVVAHGGANAIATINADGANFAEVVEPGPTRDQPHGGTETPRWTPDGDIIFSSNREGGPDDWHLFRLDLGSGASTQFGAVPDAIDDHGVLSPDGSTLAFTRYLATGDASEPFGPGSIYLSAPDGSEPRRLTTGPSGGSDEHPDFSPDGKWVAFSRVREFMPGSARSSIFIVGIDGEGLLELTDPALNGFHPRWSPDGDLIAFSSNADNFATRPSNVWVVAPDGTGDRQLTNQPQAFMPDWSPDGEWLAFTLQERGRSRTDLGAVRADGSETCRLWVTPGGSASEPDWAP